MRHDTSKKAFVARRVIQASVNIVINDCTHKEFLKSIKKLFGSVTLLIMR